MQYKKAKSAAKTVTPKGKHLNEIVLKTMKLASDVVGATLGPGGMPVLIERQEHDMPPMITKDGVTVFKNMGFEDSTSQTIMEAARDAAVRTANEAGDGTTTATILSEAIVRHSSEYLKNNPKESPQRVIRHIQSLFLEMEKTIKDSSLPATKAMLNTVAKVSANGDTALADKVLECFDLVGDEGNVTITEINGPAGYEVEKIEGFPIAMGYEESCAKFYAKFINDPGNQRTYLDNPVFLIYHGRITEIQQLAFLMENIGSLWQADGFRHNVVVVATGFSESVLGQLAMNFAHASTINVFPLLAPQSPIANGQLHFLEDLAAVVGARVLDSLNSPLEKATVDDLGYGDGVKSFEATRFRSTVVGFKDDDEILLRADELKAQLANSESLLEQSILQERLGKLTGGIAKLKIIGASNGELKERRDRAEDAVCAVRGAINHGCLPGGGWTLMKLVCRLNEQDPIAAQILAPALMAPVQRLLSNCGLSEEQIDDICTVVCLRNEDSSWDARRAVVYDALEQKLLEHSDLSVLDSVPAVLEALRNSLSIASLLGLMGGIVVYKRDDDFERREATANNDFLRDANSNPADERP